MAEQSQVKNTGSFLDALTDYDENAANKFKKLQANRKKRVEVAERIAKTLKGKKTEICITISWYSTQCYFMLNEDGAATKRNDHQAWDTIQTWPTIFNEVLNENNLIRNNDGEPLVAVFQHLIDFNEECQISFNYNDDIEGE